VLAGFLLALVLGFAARMGGGGAWRGPNRRIKKRQFCLQLDGLCLYGFAGISSSNQRPALGRVEAIAPSKASCKKWRLK
jgi:hypothetical protein